MWVLVFGVVLMVLVLFAAFGWLLLCGALDGDARARDAGLEREDWS